MLEDQWSSIYYRQEASWERCSKSVFSHVLFKNGQGGWWKRKNSRNVKSRAMEKSWLRATPRRQNWDLIIISTHPKNRGLWLHWCSGIAEVLWTGEYSVSPILHLCEWPCVLWLFCLFHCGLPCLFSSQASRSRAMVGTVIFLTDTCQEWSTYSLVAGSPCGREPAVVTPVWAFPVAEENFIAQGHVS